MIVFREGRIPPSCSCSREPWQGPDYDSCRRRVAMAARRQNDDELVTVKMANVICRPLVCKITKFRTLYRNFFLKKSQNLCGRSFFCLPLPLPEHGVELLDDVVDVLAGVVPLHPAQYKDSPLQPCGLSVKHAHASSPFLSSGRRAISSSWRRHTSW